MSLHDISILWEGITFLDTLIYNIKRMVLLELLDLFLDAVSRLQFIFFIFLASSNCEQKSWDCMPPVHF